MSNYSAMLLLDQNKLVVIVPIPSPTHPYASIRTHESSSLTVNFVLFLVGANFAATCPFHISPFVSRASMRFAPTKSSCLWQDKRGSTSFDKQSTVWGSHSDSETNGVNGTCEEHVKAKSVFLWEGETKKWAVTFEMLPSKTSSESGTHTHTPVSGVEECRVNQA